MLQINVKLTNDIYKIWGINIKNAYIYRYMR